MNVTVHLPAEPEKARELQKKVAEVHSRVILAYVKQLECPFEQKKRILKRILEEAKKRSKKAAE